MKKLICWLFSFFLTGVFAQDKPQNGVAESKPAMIALKNATVIVSPEKTLQHATLLIEGYNIREVGTFVKIPEGTLEIDCSGKIIMPGFIELNSSVGISTPVPIDLPITPQLETSKKGPYSWNEAVHPETRASEQFKPIDIKNDSLKKLGFCSAITHIPDGIFQGTASYVLLGNNADKNQVIIADAAQFLSFNKGVSNQQYPTSQMGAIALIRQTFYDYDWYKKAENKETNLSLDALIQSEKLPYFFQTEDKWEILRAEKIADEFKLNMQYIGTGKEYMLLNELKNWKSGIVIPINFPEPFDVSDPYLVKEIPLSELKNWELAPSNPYFLQQNGNLFAFTATGNTSEKIFWKNIRKSIERGLTAEQALAALTTNPAKIAGISDISGTLEKGKLANFLIFSENPFQSETQLEQVWIAGKGETLFTPNKNDITGIYDVLLDKHIYPLEIKKQNEKWTGKLQTTKHSTDPKTGAVTNDTLTPEAHIKLSEDDILLQFVINDDHFNGNFSLHGKVNTKIGVFEGDAILPDGKWIRWNAIKTNSESAKKEEITTISDTAYRDKIWFPNRAFGSDSLASQKNYVIRHATVWTNEQEGILNDATVIVSNGKIHFVGTGNYNIPNGSIIIDAQGKHLTSGIIDEHSHIAISKGVNEAGKAITAEVRIGDVLNPDDINIYRQLAGGVTASQLLHGSANPIGGHSALIKLKWGVSPDQLLIPNAPEFIKFALGENVKQSNWGDFNTVRFPQSRMGVEQVFYDGFLRARIYEQQWKSYVAAKKGAQMPRKDLELETLAEILNAERNITCHSYVQSEINMLMHVADSMGFHINTFTHILEGYKVADKLKAHGAGAGTFSDWWGYKFEVKDAIPYNAAMLVNKGITTAINSDDAEMGRRLNQEAAKTVKYGGLTQEQAWKLVTLNPAILLHLDDRMGSIRAGKDADLVLWSDNPLSIKAIVNWTMIDGIMEYDAEKDALLQLKITAEKARIINKMMQAQQKGEPTKPFIRKKSKRFHCDTLGEEGSEEHNIH